MGELTPVTNHNNDPWDDPPSGKYHTAVFSPVPRDAPNLVNLLENGEEFVITFVWLVGQGHPVLKNMSSSIGMIIATQFFWENARNGNPPSRYGLCDHQGHKVSW